MAAPTDLPNVVRTAVPADQALTLGDLELS
jgi:hypothetical protein